MIRSLYFGIAIMTFTGCWNASVDFTTKKPKNGDSGIAKMPTPKTNEPETQLPAKKNNEPITEQSKQERPKTEVAEKPKTESTEVADKPRIQTVNVDVLHPGEFKVGQRGPIITNPQTLKYSVVNKQSRSATNVDSGVPIYWFEVDSVLSNKEVLVREHVVSDKKNKRAAIKFIVEMSTDGLADNARILLNGVMEVVGTKKVGTATYYVIR